MEYPVTRAAKRRQKRPRQAALLVTLLTLMTLMTVVACARSVGGTVAPASDLKPHPVTGPSILRVLLDDHELSKALRQGFSPPGSTMRFGGPEQLFDMKTAPAQCGGAVFERQASNYPSGSVQNVAHESVWNSGAVAKVIDVDEAVIALPTAAAADAVFAQFAQQWEFCNGKIVTNYGPNGQPFSTSTVSDVKTADPVLSATVRTKIVESVTHGRAIGVRVNCLVEVDVAYFGKAVDDSAANLARQMMGKVSQLS